MLRFKYFSILVSILLVIETNQQIIHPNDPSCNLVCNDGNEINLRTCSCVNMPSNESKRKARPFKSVSVLKLISVDEFTSERCSNDEIWNGSACVSTSFCPGGYHWNGRACIIQTSVQTAVSVPSAPDTKCKYAQEREEDTPHIEIPSTVMPTFSTSPLCPFGFVWSDERCVRNPVCPVRYVYYDNICHLNLQQTREIPTESTTQQTLPPIENILKQNVINRNKWLQKPWEVDDNSETTNSTDQNDRTCCSIMSPRMCRIVSSKLGGNWQCGHHRYRICAEICSKPTIYLRTKTISFNDPVLIMPPPPPRLMKLLQRHVFRETNIGN